MLIIQYLTPCKHQTIIFSVQHDIMEISFAWSYQLQSIKKPWRLLSWAVFIWCFMEYLCLKFLPQISHLILTFSWKLRMCTFNVSLPLKVDEHRWHLNRFFSWVVAICRSKLYFLGNDASQSVQGYSLSPCSFIRKPFKFSDQWESSPSSSSKFSPFSKFVEFSKFAGVSKSAFSSRSKKGVS